MRFRKLLCLGLLLAACWVVPGAAQARGGMHGGDGLTFGRQLLHALNLSESQKEQVRTAFNTYRDTARPLWTEMRTTRQHLQDVLLNPSGLDTTAVQTDQQHLASLQADLLQARITLAETLRGVLTPAQLTQAAQITQQLRALGEERHQLLTPQTQP
jgi:Spy/CpxP family protein refolding chaperone